MRFLISRLSSLGDVVCTLPAAVALKSTYPASRIAWVVDRRFADVVHACSAVDEVILAKQSLVRSAWPELDEPFDAAFDLQGLFKSAWPIFLANAPVKLGYHWQREGSALFSRAVLPDATSFHIVDQYVDVVRAYGLEADRAAFGLSAAPHNLQAVEDRLRQTEGASFVVINPGAGWASKRWPATSYSQVINFLKARGLCSILIGGGAADDLALAKEVAAGCAAAPLIWTGKTSIGELIALVSLAKAHLGGDTGSTHIAAALKVPSVGLYSITNPRRSCPYGQIENCLHNPSSLADISVTQAQAVLSRVIS